VTKINKAGKRQPRIIGIDDKKIHNKVDPNKKASGMMARLKKNKIKRPFRLMEEVLEIVQEGGTSNVSACGLAVRLWPFCFAC